jgi:hypothetical protein
MFRAIAGPGPGARPPGRAASGQERSAARGAGGVGRGAVKLAPLCPRSGREGAGPAAGDDNLWQVPTGRHGRSPPHPSPTAPGLPRHTVWREGQRGHGKCLREWEVSAECWAAPCWAASRDASKQVAHISALWHALTPVEYATQPARKEGSMHRVLLTLSLLLLLVTMLVTSRVGAQAADVLFSLPLPTRPDGARAIEILEAVVVAMGAHLKHERAGKTLSKPHGTARLMSRGPLALKSKPPGLFES